MSRHLDLINCKTRTDHLAKALRDGGGRIAKAAPPADLIKGGPFVGPRGGKWADPQHKVPWDDKKHTGKATPKAGQHDEHGARELELHTDNTEHLTNETSRHGTLTQRGSIHRNLARKIASGKYDHAQAGKLFGHLVDGASKDYSKQYGAPAGGGHHFDAATRRHVAREMADQFHQEVQDGEHDHHVESGVHAKRAKAGGGLSAMAAKHLEGHGPGDNASKKQPVPELSTQGHLDEHDRHRGQESVHKHKAKLAGSKDEAAHHNTMAAHHGERADAHRDASEKKRFGKSESMSEPKQVENTLGYSDEIMQWYTA